MRSISKPNVFTSQFLNRLAHRERSSPTAAEAAYAGPWSVVERDQRFAVYQDNDAPLGLANAEFTDRETALLAAAVYPTLGQTQRFRIAKKEGEGNGFDVQAITGGRLETIGWLRHDQMELLDALQIADWLLRSPYSLASLLEAASFEVLSRVETILQGLAEEERS